MTASTTKTKEISPHAMRMGIGIFFGLVALAIIIFASGDWFWAGAAWLICGAVCTPIAVAFRNFLGFDPKTKTSDWLSYPGWGGLLLLFIFVQTVSKIRH